NGHQVAGGYFDSTGIEHGFVRGADGKITAPIDMVGAVETFVLGWNDKGLMVGRFRDSSGVERGFFLRLPDTVLILDLPGATLTSLNGINNGNLMCGRWVDASGIAHGILAEVR